MHTGESVATISIIICHCTTDDTCTLCGVEMFQVEPQARSCPLCHGAGCSKRATVHRVTSVRLRLSSPPPLCGDRALQPAPPPAPPSRGSEVPVARRMTGLCVGGHGQTLHPLVRLTLNRTTQPDVAVGRLVKVTTRASTLEAGCPEGSAERLVCSFAAGRHAVTRGLILSGSAYAGWLRACWRAVWRARIACEQPPLHESLPVCVGPAGAAQGGELRRRSTRT